MRRHHAAETKLVLRMIRNLPLRLPLVIAAALLSASTMIFHLFLGLSWLQALDSSVAIMAGARPHSVSLVGFEGTASVVIMILIALGFTFRVFLIAYWAAYFVKRKLEQDELRKLRRELIARAQGEDSLDYTGKVRSVILN
jgi:hypothetical protein